MTTEELRLVLPVFHTRGACCGAATAFLLRRIAYRAGAYAPGIDDSLFGELHASDGGATIDHVVRWFERRRFELHALGYRVQCEGVTKPATDVLAWVRQGRGYRGAVMTLHHREDVPSHSVGITVDRLDPNFDDELVMIDPWPATTRDRARVPPPLAFAHRDGQVSALAVHWVGWS